MRSFGFRLTFLAAILWMGIGSTARALGHHRDAVETVYVMPSSVGMPVATSYVISTSRAVPTAYAVPTYYTTAYWLDPVVVAQPLYAETSYVRRGGLLGRRWVVERPLVATYATSYVPTTYYAPTTVYRSTSYAAVDPLVVPSAYVAASDCPCPTTIASAAPVYSAPARNGGGSAGVGSRSRSLRSEAEDRSTMDSAVEPPADDLNPAPRGGGLGASAANAREAETNREPAMPESVRDNTPPAPPAPASPPTRTQPSGPNVRPVTPGTTEAAQPVGAGAAPAASTGGTSAPATGGDTGPPTAPSSEVDTNGLPPITPPGPARRDSLKPSTYAMRPVPDGLRNILIGTVRSRSGGELEEGVRISLRKAGNGTGKETMTNALGKFAVRLTDGDWDVDVAMPSGRVYVVSRLRVSDGLIVDSYGRRVPSLEITR